jgi:hypothetical protein
MMVEAAACDAGCALATTAAQIGVSQIPKICRFGDMGSPRESCAVAESQPCAADRAADLWAASIPRHLQDELAEFGQLGNTLPPYMLRSLSDAHQRLRQQPPHPGAAPASLIVTLPNPPPRRCVLSGRPLRPRPSDFSAIDRRGLILDWSLRQGYLKERGCWPLPCPYERVLPGETRKHVTQLRNTTSFKAVIVSGGPAVWALIASSDCLACRLKFLHSDHRLLEVLPRGCLFMTGLCGDCNRNESNVLFSDEVVQMSVMNHRMRQGDSNEAAKYYQLLGHESARRACLYFDECHVYLQSLDAVSCTSWHLMEESRKISLIELRGEWLAFHRDGMRFTSWPGDPHHAMGSPALDRFAHEAKHRFPVAPVTRR